MDGQTCKEGVSNNRDSASKKEKKMSVLQSETMLTSGLDPMAQLGWRAVVDAARVEPPVTIQFQPALISSA